MKITVKTWIYRKAQESAGCGRTLLWDEAKVWTGDKDIRDIDVSTKEGVEYFCDESNWEKAYHLYGEVTRETEKAILLEAKYWDLRYCRYATDAPVRAGWKVWIPKSAVYDLDKVLEARAEA